jgi:D-alanine transaminase
MTTVYLNGDFIAKDRAAIAVDDRGFLFGDGIYDVVRVIDGQLFEWHAHAERMAHSLAGLRIEIGADRIAALEGVCQRLIHDNGLAGDGATVYLAVTRGAAPRTHGFPPPGTPPTVFVSASRFVERRELKHGGCQAITAEDLRWARCDWKTLNVLGSVLARQAAAEAGAYEAILVRDGLITEGAASTVFAVVDDVVRTHPLSTRILPSVTRKLVLGCAAELGIAVREVAMTQAELLGAAEIMICGTTTDVMPVVRLDGRPVGAGSPGPIATRLRDAFDARLYPRNPRESK